MNRTLVLACCALLGADAACLFADPVAPPTVMARCGALLFSDDFERPELGDKWRFGKKSHSIRDGVFVTGQPDPMKHPAVCRTDLNAKDVVVDFKVKFDGGRGLSVVFNDKAYDGSHAGHICRASLSPTQISVGDDREGAMKFGIFEKWQNPDTRSEVEAIVNSRKKSTPTTVEPGRWYRMTVELLGDEMVASLDGKPLVRLKSPGFDHPNKTEWGFTTQGEYVDFDDVSVWAAERKTTDEHR